MGLTLLELLVVAAVLSLLLAALPALRPSGPSQAAVAAKIAGALRDARAQALFEGRVASVDPTSMAPAGWVRVTPTGPRAASTAGAAEAPRPVIIFEPDGAASGARIEIAAQGRVSVIDVHWLTGAVQRSEPSR